MIIIDEAMSHQAYVTTGAMAVSQPSGYVGCQRLAVPRSTLPLAKYSAWVQKRIWRYKLAVESGAQVESGI